VRIALVVQRYSTDLVGGAETLARQYARFLARQAEVEVLTTCARNHMTWRNHYPEGPTRIEDIRVHRFATDYERGTYWSALYESTLGGIDPVAFRGSPALRETYLARIKGCSRALQEELIRRQGPFSTPLFEYLAEHQREYDAFLFFSYLFPTTYFGSQIVPSDKLLFCPTLHDEPFAHFSVFGRLFRRPRLTLYLSEAERRLAQELHGPLPASRVIGMAVEPPTAPGGLPPETPVRYVVYAGRIERSKGTNLLCDYFREFKNRQPSDLKLVLIGRREPDLLDHPDTVDLGFVSEGEKLALLRSALAFIHPSPNESFALALLESFLMGTPALVNRDNEVLADHARSSGAAFGYSSVDEFCTALGQLLGDDELRRSMGARGRAYVVEKYSTSIVERRLSEAIGDVPTSTTKPRVNADLPRLPGAERLVAGN
jgi:glycosyltransferase involved in cell wall biosynthesis